LTEPIELQYDVQERNRRKVMDKPDALATSAERIESVRIKIEEIKKGIAGGFLDLGELLVEIRDGSYHLAWGFPKFGNWLEKSGLDMSERAAYYLMKIVSVGRELGIPRETLQEVKLSKLKEIISLDVKKHGEQIKQLIESCRPSADRPEPTLDEVRINVQKVKGGEEIDIYIYKTLKVTQAAWDNTIVPAIEAARKEFGDSVDDEGNPVEISIGHAIELICADHLADVDQIVEAATADAIASLTEGEPEAIDVEVVEETAMPVELENPVPYPGANDTVPQNQSPFAPGNFEKWYEPK
jgi:hypothetical protein